MRSLTLISLWVILLFLGCRRQKESTFSSPSWEPQTLGRNTSIRGLSAVDEQVCWLSGAGNTIARTVDGGRSWQLLPAPASDTLDFRDIEAFDSLRAIVMAAGPGDRSRVYSTTDGGRSWQLLYLNPFEAGFFNGIAFWDEHNGILTGDPIDGALFLIRTRDGGATWERLPPGQLPPVDSAEYGFAASGTHITVAGDSLVWIGTGGTTARVFLSPDRGDTWTAHPTPMLSGNASSGIFSLAFANARDGIAVGGNYAEPSLARQSVILTSDGGHSWHLAPQALPYRSCVRYLNGLYLAAGPTGTDFSGDSGRSWTAIDTTGYHVISVAKKGEAAWAAGSDGKVGKWKGEAEEQKNRGR